MKVLAPTLRSAAKQLKISHSELYRQIKSGEILVETFIKDGERVYLICKTPSGTNQEKNPDFEPSVKNLGAKIAMTNLKPASSAPGHARYFEEWLEWYSDDIDVTAWSERYKKDQKLYINKYFAQYDRISADNLRKFIAEVKDPVEHLTLRRHRHRAVSSFARFLYEKKRMLPRQEYETIKKLYPPKPKGYKPTQHIIEREQMPSIFKAIEKASEGSKYKAALLRALIAVYGSTGMRLSEAANLKISKMRFHENIEKAYLIIKRKGGKEQTVPFPTIAQYYVLEYMRDFRPAPEKQKCGSDDLLFWACNEHTKRYTPLQANVVVKYMRLVSKAAGFKFTTHSFRHEWITGCFNDNMNPAHIQQLAGHTDIRTTQIYKHVLDKHAIKSVNDLAWDKFGLSDPSKAKPVQSDNGKETLVEALQSIAKLSPQEKALILQMVNPDAEPPARKLG